MNGARLQEVTGVILLIVNLDNLKEADNIIFCSIC